MARNHVSSLWGTTRYNVLAYTYKNNQLTMSQPKSNDELIEEFNKLHTVSVAIESGMLVGNNTEEECIKSYERLEQFFLEALAQKDAEVAALCNNKDMSNAILRVVHELVLIKEPKAEHVVEATDSIVDVIKFFAKIDGGRLHFTTLESRAETHPTKQTED